MTEHGESERRLQAVRDTGLDASPDPSLDRACRLVTELFGVPVSLASLVDDHRQFFPGAFGVDLRETPLSQSLCATVVDRAAPLQIDDMDDSDFAEHGARGLGVAAYLGAPLVDEQGRVLGSLCAIDVTPRSWTPRDVAVLVDLAAGVSADLQSRILRTEQERLVAEARRANDRLRVIAEVGEAFASTLRVDQIAEALVGAIKGHVGSSAVAYVHGDAEDEATPLWIGLEGQRTLQAGSIDDAGMRFLLSRAATLASGTTTRSLTRDQIERATDAIGAVTEWTPLLAHESFLLIALRIPRRTLGWVLVAGATPDEHEVRLATELARRAATAIHQAQQFDEQRRVSLVLQQSLLPPLAAVDGYTAGAVYRPAVTSNEVGGDWYDFMALPDGGAGVAIGDVTGHNVAAAATMGRVRGAMRSYAWEGTPPAGVIDRLDRISTAIMRKDLATCIYGRLDRTGSGAWLTWCNAGHLAPIAIAPDGSASLLQGDPNPLIGTSAWEWIGARDELKAFLPNGTILVMYTDGLIERRTEDIISGVDRLLAALADVVRLGLDIQSLCEAVVDLDLSDGGDDVAVLAVRVDELG